MGHRIGRLAAAVTAILALTMVLAVPAAAAGLKTVAVAPGVWAFVGPMTQRNPDNLGNNATFGLIETDAGAVVVDAGAGWKAAAALDAAIRKVTDARVVYVIDTGGQDHRWLGNGYWAAHGATVVASAAAVADQKARAGQQLAMLTQLVGPAGLAGTDPVYATRTFDHDLTLTLGGQTIKIVHPGPAHTPGDSFVWLPAARISFTGDIVFTERLLGIMDYSSSAGWIKAFKAMAAMDPAIVVPGHGQPTTLARAKADTLDYLVALRAAMRTYMDNGGEIIGSVKVDQSAFARLGQFDALAGRNAQQVFAEMEWE